MAAYIEAGGVLLPHLAERCAGSLRLRRWHGLFALQSRNSIVQPRRRSFLQRSELGIRNTTWSGHALPLTNERGRRGEISEHLRPLPMSSRIPTPPSAVNVG